MTTPSGMPQLPEPEEYDSPGAFSHDQMHAFAEQYRKAWVASLKPAAWLAVGHENITLDEDQAAQWSDMGARVVPLYRLDDQP